MKSFLALVSLVSLAVASPLSGLEVTQFPLNVEEASYPGFDLDLNAQRLVQMEGQPPVWMTELEKVYYIRLYPRNISQSDSLQIQVKARGVKFFDM